LYSGGIGGPKFFFFGYVSSNYGDGMNSTYMARQQKEKTEQTEAAA